MNNIRTARFKSEYARRMPDPVDQKKDHHYFWIKAVDLPIDLPIDSNPRDKNLNLGVYKDVENSFLNKEGVTPYTFHLKNKGIHIAANQINKIKEGLYEVNFLQGEGILDGNHTYSIMTKNSAIVPDQYVQVKITTNIDQDFLPEMAGGLNSSVQVHTESLLNQEGAFDWIKEIFKGMSYEDKVSYKENQNLPIDIRELIAIMTIFDSPIDGNISERHPKYTYSSKAKCLNQYKENPKSYQRLRLVLKEILELHDYIKLEGPRFHNKLGGRAGNLNYVEKRKNTTEKLIFIEDETKIFLSKGALYPILGAFRWFLQENPKNGLYTWKTKNGFNDILDMWRKYGDRLMASIQDAYNAVGKDPNSLGKSTVTWASVYSELLSSCLQDQDMQSRINR